MTTYVALLRGINVGKSKRIKMEPLRELVSDLGFENVRTLVNSGNVVLTGSGKADDIARQIESALAEQHKLDVAEVVRTEADLQRIIAANPFPDIAATPKLLHVWFLGSPLPDNTTEELAALDTGEDTLAVTPREIYLHAPNGLSDSSKAVQDLDRKLPAGSTSRNWNTVTRLAAMASE